VSPDAMPPPHPLDPLGVDGLALGTQRGMNAPGLIAAPVLRVNPPDIDRQLAIGDLARAFRP